MACTLMLFSLATQKEGIKSYKYTSLFQQDINNGNFDHLDLAITPNMKKSTNKNKEIMTTIMETQPLAKEKKGIFFFCCLIFFSFFFFFIYCEIFFFNRSTCFWNFVKFFGISSGEYINILWGFFFWKKIIFKKNHFFFFFNSVLRN